MTAEMLNVVEKRTKLNTEHLNTKTFRQKSEKRFQYRQRRGYLINVKKLKIWVNGKIVSTFIKIPKRQQVLEIAQG